MEEVRGRFYGDGMTAVVPAAEPTLVVAGLLRRPDGSWGPGEIWVAGDTIAAVQDGRLETPGVRRIEVGDGFVLPGGVDAHVHCLSHPGEGIAAATRAAAAGGVTTIVEMPFDASGPINSRDRLLTKQDLVADEAVIDVALLGTLAPGGGWREADGLAESGVVGFKVSLFLTDAFRFPRISDYELRHVMRAVAETGRTLCAHAENNEIIQGLLADLKPTRPTDPGAHARTRPPIAERLGALTALEVAAEQGTALHVCHLSLPGSVDLVRWYQTQDVDVTAETCPHYLTFTEADMEVQRGRLKINPPLRTPADRAGLWDRIIDGVIGIISSDHAPWPLQLKDNDHILENHSGVPGVETLVDVVLSQALGRGDDLAAFSAAVDALTIGPARRYGLDARKGSLEVGKDADIITFELDAGAAIDGSALHSNAGWSPYDGFAAGGRVTHTISRGDVVWASGAGMTASGGRGRVVQRDGRP